MLRRIEDTCHSRFEAALEQKTCKGSKSSRCASTCIGFLVQLHHAMEMSIYRSHSADAGHTLPRSVRFYWHEISQMRALRNFTDSARYPPVAHNQSAVTTHCAYDVCMAGLDPKAAIDAMLNKYDHSGLAGDWASTQVRSNLRSCT